MWYFVTLDGKSVAAWLKIMANTKANYKESK
jgi:hypothetical protein